MMNRCAQCGRVTGPLGMGPALRPYGTDEWLCMECYDEVERSDIGCAPPGTDVKVLFQPPEFLSIPDVEEKVRDRTEKECLFIAQTLYNEITEALKRWEALTGAKIDWGEYIHVNEYCFLYEELRDQ